MPNSCYEGRIRPSLIAAQRAGVGALAQSVYEGRIRPSLIAAFFFRRTRRRLWSYEGRIRPSLIAAQGAEATVRFYQRPTRGEFAPPSLRL